MTVRGRHNDSFPARHARFGISMDVRDRAVQAFRAMQVEAINQKAFRRNCFRRQPWWG
jgi:hypothetical protein